MKIIYLAHNKESKIAKQIRDTLQRQRDIIVVDPFEMEEKDYYELYPERDIEKYAQLLYNRDIVSLRHADIVIAVFEGKQPFVGTSMEVMYAASTCPLLNNEKRIIVVTDNFQVSIHPFLISLREQGLIETIIFSDDIEEITYKILGVI